MRNVRIILHAGVHKTGTTSIQHALFQAREDLARNGILYPQTGCPEWARQGHHLLPWSLVQRDGVVPVFRGRVARFDAAARDELWRTLRAEIETSGAHTVVISSEEFDILNNEEIIRLKGYLRGFDLCPVIAVRNHVDFIESMYKTTVLYHEYEGNIEAFVAYGVRSRLDLSAMCTAWGALAEAGWPILLAYDTPGIQRNIVDVFLKRVGIDGNLLPQARAWHNPSFPAFLYEIARFMRLSGRSEHEIDRFVVQTGMAAWRRPLTRSYVFMNAQVRTFVAKRYEHERKQLLAMPHAADAFDDVLPPAYEPISPDRITQIADHFDALAALAREVQPGKDINWPQQTVVDAPCLV